MFRSIVLCSFLASTSLSVGCMQDNPFDDDAVTDNAQLERGGKTHQVAPAGTCEGACGVKSANGDCWCDDACEGYGDCCSDKVQICDGPPTGFNLSPRLGGLAVYDADRDITWLADANAGAGSIYDDGNITDDGAMSWVNANAWAQSLDVGGFTDWRLPNVPPTASGGGSGGYCIGTCPDSEMGHLFYDELSGTRGESILTSGDPDLDLFTNIQSKHYWTNTIPNSADVYKAAQFSLDDGVQIPTVRTYRKKRAWAVRNGDVQ